jgi:hypothetical protein
MRKKNWHSSPEQQEKSVGSWRKNKRDKNESTEREKKKGEFTLFPPFFATWHWKPGPELIVVRKSCPSGPAIESCISSCPGCPRCLLLLSCPDCPVLAVLFCLSCSACTVWRADSSWSVLPVLLWLSRSGCPVQAVLLRLSFSGCPLRAVLPWLSWPSSPVLAALSWQSCPCSLVLATLSWQSRPGSPVPGCSGQEKPGSWGRRSEALINLGSGNLEWGGNGEGWGRGGQFTSNLRPRRTDPVTERRVSK